MIGYAFLFSFRKADLYPLTHGIFIVFHRNLFYFCIFACVCVKIIVYTNFMSDEINEITEGHSDYKPADARDENGELLPDEQRLTKFGKVLRATSLDELPEAFNILKGDMSVIGPRPLLVKYLPRYSERQHRRHEVRPGLSGYAQVHGRNTVSWQDKFEMDVKYVDHITFLGDLKIIWGSVMAAFVRRGGISSETSVTMEEFMGNGMVAK